MTLIEVLVASVIASVVAAGTAASFAAAARMTRAPGHSRTVEAVGYARETAERFRTRVACDGEWFAADAACATTGTIPGTWTSDPLPAPAPGVEPILTTGARRCYRVTPQDCDGAGGPGDCLAIQVHVCWNNDFVNCPC